jgi:hypothetical protein
MAVRTPHLLKRNFVMFRGAACMTKSDIRLVDAYAHMDFFLERFS